MHAVLAENWVVYTYWSAASHRFQASVLELYDDSPRSLGPMQLVFGANNATLSSYQPPAQLQVRLSSSLTSRLPRLYMVFGKNERALEASII